MKKLILSLVFLSSIYLVENCNSLPKSSISQFQATEYTNETKAKLMGTLMQKIEENGIENALEFCNINAIPITQSIADQHLTQIKRVSDRNRNPKNAANSEELKLISQYKKEIQAGKMLKPVVKNNYLYTPIVTQSQCLKCHGTPGETIALPTAKKIKELYPKDLALGYKENEIRGLFLVSLQ